MLVALRRRGELGEQRALLATLWLMLRLFPGKAPTVQPWALAGYALASCEAMVLTALWLRGFRKREGVEPWMLKNLSVALRARWLDGRALAVNRHALTLPADDATLHHRLWLAFHEATEGRSDDARALLQGITETALSRLDQMVLCFTQSMLQVQAAPREERAPAAREARRAMLAAFPGRPVLLDRFLEDAFELDVDADVGVREVEPLRHHEHARRCLLFPVRAVVAERAAASTSSPRAACTRPTLSDSDIASSTASSPSRSTTASVRRAHASAS